MVRKKNQGDEAAKTEDCCKRKKKRTRYLPQDIVFQFLLNLAAQPLHDVARHVCREWSLIVSSPSFAHHHHHPNSSGGVLIQPSSPMTPRKGFYLEVRRGRLEVSEFDCDSFNVMLGTSCNGLRVFTDRRGPYDTLVVINPLTKRFTVLPPYPGGGRMAMVGLSFAEASMVYKVAQAVSDVDTIVPKTRIALLTIGVDRVWRHIDIRHLLFTSKERRVCCAPVSAIGYVYWPYLGLDLVLTLNIETERVCRFSLPPLPNLHGIFLAMGSNLSFIQISSKGDDDVWEMNSVSGEWTLLFSIDKQNDLIVLEKYPVCWLTAREILFYGHHRRKRGGGVALAYNCRTREIQSFEWKWGPRCWYRFRPHVNSLLWWER